MQMRRSRTFKVVCSVNQMQLNSIQLIKSAIGHLAAKFGMTEGKYANEDVQGRLQYQFNSVGLTLDM